IDAGASASDDCSGDLTSQIVVDLGGLDTNSPALGVYTLTFSVTDGAGNHSSTTRQVTVRDTVPPVITVTLGVTTVECHTSYNDAGATVADDCDASPTLGSIGSVDANTPNDYTITYTAQDATGNTSTATRVVHVIDNIPPVVTLNGDPSVTIECHSLYNELGATVTDACDTNVTVSIINGVDTNTPSVYVLTYSSTDASGNTGTKTRTVTVNDTQPPLMALNGLASVDVECHSAYTELGATATDACEGNIVVGPPTGTVETNALGDYTLTYSACDSGAHCASIIRVVHVVDHTAPLVTVTGATTVDICLGSAYTELGATASDTCEGSLPASISGGTVDTNAVGSYTLTYAATDGSGNTGTATRVVNVSDCGISITTQPADKLKQPQGATVTLSVVATAPLGTLSYQWYEQNVAVDSTTNPTATNATFIFTAHTNAAAPHFTNVTYNVVISGQDNHTATSANAHVTVIVDKAPPTVVLSSPKANARSDSFTIIGTATDPDKSGTIAKIVYQYTNSNGGGTAMFTNTFNAPTNKYTFTIPGVTFPAGTNTLYVWAMDLAGHINFAKPAVVKGLFSRVTDTFTLNLVGDGNGTVTASTKGSALESVSGLPLSGGAVNASVVLNLNKYQLYTLTFTPDTATNAPISSVVSNAPSTLNVAGSVNIANSDSIRKVTYTFMFNGAESHTVYFNRNRKKDMAGVYNGVFSEDGNPSIASSGLVQNMNIGATGTYTVKLLNVGVLSPTIKGIIAADGTTTGLSTDGKYVLQGFLDWSGSATNGPKQFIGTVSNTIAGWSSSFIADRTEKSLLTAGTKKTMIIPSMAGGPSGDSFATIKDTSGSSRSFAFTLADNAKLVTYTAAATASGNFPIYIYPKYATTTDSHAQSVLFGTWNTASNQVTLNWVKAAGGVYNPDGFTNAHLADISSFTTGLSGDHIVTITNVPTGLGLAYRMHFDGTNLVTHLTDHLYPSTNSIAVKQDSTGKITVTFGNPGPKVKSTGYAGVVENNSTNGVASGFFIPLGGTNSGVISIVPAP
ncbi:MAG: immunoglobulin-like domain-containing protein, partial [Limisphaerales bacterium]